MSTIIIRSNALKIPIMDCSIQSCITSPPYWGLRSYGIGIDNGELGMEPTPQEYISHLVEVFREVRRILKDNGTLWLNIGDSYAGSGGAGDWSRRKAGKYAYAGQRPNVNRVISKKNSMGGLKPKDMVGIPWMLAFALRDDGWYLRSDIIWYKTNPNPESVEDRPIKSHEYVFLLSKTRRYYYDKDAVKEPHQDKAGPPDRFKGQSGVSREEYEERKWTDRSDGLARPPMTMKNRQYNPLGRDLRTVWIIPTHPYRGAHFATYPEELARRCILAGSKMGDTVLDPFNGAGTTGVVAIKYGRNYIGCDLNPDYIQMTKRRFAKVQIILPLPTPEVKE